MQEALKKHAKGERARLLLIMLALLLLLVITSYSASLGVNESSMRDLYKALYRALILQEPLEDRAQKVILHLRLPRLLLAILAGTALGVAGVAMQAVTRNVLVSPFTIGISSAAAFGASLAIVFNIGLFSGSLNVVFNAFFMAMSCIVLIYILSLYMQMGAQTIVLVGIALNYFFAALTQTSHFFASEHKLAQALHWTFGSLNLAGWPDIAFIAPVVLLCLFILLFYSKSLDVVALGDDELASSLGINVNKIRVLMGLIAALATACVISFTGVIGFIGLVSPHIARMLIKSKHIYLLPFSALIGALLLVVADTLGRLLLAPVILPVGIVISFIGVPLFIQLIILQRKKERFL